MTGIITGVDPTHNNNELNDEFISPALKREINAKLDKENIASDDRLRELLSAQVVAAAIEEVRTRYRRTCQLMESMPGEHKTTVTSQIRAVAHELFRQQIYSDYLEYCAAQGIKGRPLDIRIFFMLARNRAPYENYLHLYRLGIVKGDTVLKGGKTYVVNSIDQYCVIKSKGGGNKPKLVTPTSDLVKISEADTSSS